MGRGRGATVVPGAPPRSHPGGAARGVKTTSASSSSGPASHQVLRYFPFIISKPLRQPLQAGRAISILQTRLNEVL